MQRENLLEVGDHVLLVGGAKLHPARDKRCIEQLPGREERREGQEEEEEEEKRKRGKVQSLALE